MHSLKSSPLGWEPKTAENIRNLVPYKPGKPIEETQREYGIQEVIKLASNENPLGPSPIAIESLKSQLQKFHLYPDASHFSLKSKLSKKFGCSTDELSVGCGSNELIDLLLRVFVPAGCNVVSPKYSFVAYRLCAQLNGCDFIESKVSEDFIPDTEDLLRKINEKTRVVMLANPNNPTGAVIPKAALENLAKTLDQKKILLVLDYAYWEYVTSSEIPEPMSFFEKHPNVIVLKTFSKIYGLAALRIGYSIARKEITSLLERSRQPFNVSLPALVAAEASLEDETHLKKSIDINNEGLAYLKTEMTKAGLRVYPSQGNFLLVDFKKDVQALYPQFLKQGIIIRPVDNYGLKTFFRISCGLPAENQKFIRSLNGIDRSN